MARETSTSAGESLIRLGVSSCLLGQSVRYEGGHKRDRFVSDLLGSFVEWVPVCPEVEVGMGVPRPALRLVRHGGDLRLVEIQSGRDHTRRMQRYATRRARELRHLELCGYVFKQDSPSCGMSRVVVHRARGAPVKDGQGMFASALMRAYPSLPVAKEGHLGDPRLRENFIERVFAYRRLQDLFRGRWTPARVFAFHNAHELQLMAHSPVAFRELGRLVASVKRSARATFRERYSQGFMGALAQLASRGRGWSCGASTPRP